MDTQTLLFIPKGTSIKNQLLHEIKFIENFMWDLFTNFLNLLFRRATFLYESCKNISEVLHHFIISSIVFKFKKNSISKEIIASKEP